MNLPSEQQAGDDWTGANCDRGESPSISACACKPKFWRLSERWDKLSQDGA